MLWRGSFRQTEEPGHTCMSQIPLPWSLHVALSSAVSPVKQRNSGVWQVEERQLSWACRTTLARQASHLELVSSSESRSDL